MWIPNGFPMDLFLETKFELNSCQAHQDITEGPPTECRSVFQIWSQVLHTCVKSRKLEYRQHHLSTFPYETTNCATIKSHSTLTPFLCNHFCIPSSGKKHKRQSKPKSILLIGQIRSTVKQCGRYMRHNTQYSTESNEKRTVTMIYDINVDKRLVKRENMNGIKCAVIP